MKNRNFTVKCVQFGIYFTPKKVGQIFINKKAGTIFRNRLNAIKDKELVLSIKQNIANLKILIKYQAQVLQFGEDNTEMLTEIDLGVAKDIESPFGEDDGDWFEIYGYYIHIDWRPHIIVYTPDETRNFK